jgi:hypothetical protein
VDILYGQPLAARIIIPSTQKSIISVTQYRPAQQTRNVLDLSLVLPPLPSAFTLRFPVSTLPRAQEGMHCSRLLKWNGFRRRMYTRHRLLPPTLNLPRDLTGGGEQPHEAPLRTPLQAVDILNVYSRPMSARKWGSRSTRRYNRIKSGKWSPPSV